MSLHERVARKMSESISVGSYYHYEQILAVLKERFHDEAELRRVIELANMMGEILVPGFRYLDEGTAEGEGTGTQQ